MAQCCRINEILECTPKFPQSKSEISDNISENLTLKNPFKIQVIYAQNNFYSIGLK